MKRALDPPDFLDRAAGETFDPGRVHLLDRWQPVVDWMAARRGEGLDPSRKMTLGRIGPRLVGRDGDGRGISGINFASQDYLSLTSHRRILAAASSAGRRYGVHSAGTANQMGLNPLTVELGRKIADFVGLAEATIFPAGWMAGFAAVRALVADGDHVLIDTDAHHNLQEGARASGATIHPIAQGNLAGFAMRLERLRDQFPQSGVLVVTDILTGPSAAMPDLRAMADLCRRYAATLLVDISEDLGVLGASGRGLAEIQGMLGKIDVVVGSFAKVFAANGGFVASSHPAMRMALRLGGGVQARTNAMSPVQAAVVLTALDIVAGAEGCERRERLRENIARLRGGLLAEGFEVMGEPAPVVPVRLGSLARARRLTSEMLQNGALVNLEEGLVQTRSDGYWRLTVMADHEAADIDEFIRILVAARARISR